MTAGRKLSGISSSIGPTRMDLVFIMLNIDWQYLDGVGNLPLRQRNLGEAIRAFETVLLLDPTNREAKLDLALCLRDPIINRVDDARRYYNEILDAQVNG